MPRLDRVQKFIGSLALLIVFVQPGVAANGSELTPTIAVDANGRTIGQVVRAEYSLQRLLVAMTVEDQPVFVMVDGNSFTHSVNPMVFFELEGCAGEAFMIAPAPEQTFGSPSAVAGPNGTLYVGTAATIQTKLLASALWSDSCTSFSAEMPVIHATPVADLNARFTPPFRVVAPGTHQEPTR